MYLEGKINRLLELHYETACSEQISAEGMKISDEWN